MSRESDRAAQQLLGAMVYGIPGAIIAGNAYDASHRTSRHKTDKKDRKEPERHTPYVSYGDKVKKYEELSNERKARTDEFEAMGSTGTPYQPDGSEKGPGSMAEALAYLKENNLTYAVQRHLLKNEGLNIPLINSASKLHHMEWADSVATSKRKNPREANRLSEEFHASPLAAMQERAEQQRTVEDEFFANLGNFLSELESSRLVNIAYLQAALISPEHPVSSYTLDQSPLTEYNVGAKTSREKELLEVIQSIDERQAILDALAPLWMKHIGKDHIPVYDSNGHEVTDLTDYAPFNRSSHFEGVTLLEENDHTLQMRGTSRERINGHIAKLIDEPDKLAGEITSDMSQRYSSGQVETTLIYLEQYSGLSRDAQREKLAALKGALEERLAEMTQPEAEGKFAELQIQRARNAIEMVSVLGISPLDKEPAMAQSTSRAPGAGRG